jgi:HEAT repeat protein
MRAVTLMVVVLVLASTEAHYVTLGEPETAGEHLNHDDLHLEDTWVDHLYSSNPREAAAATQWVQENADDALSSVVSVFSDPDSTREELRAALRACALLRDQAALLVPLAARFVSQSNLAADAATALTYMGREAFEPLQSALTHGDPIVRREALRAVGKLVNRAPLDPASVGPLLITGMSDADAGVRTVAATYLGIVKASATDAVPALTTAMEDQDPNVRLAAATALEAFGSDAQPALEVLKKAMTDKNEDVAREAGRALVTISAVR